MERGRENGKEGKRIENMKECSRKIGDEEEAEVREEKGKEEGGREKE